MHMSLKPNGHQVRIYLRMKFSSQKMHMIRFVRARKIFSKISFYFTIPVAQFKTSYYSTFLLILNAVILWQFLGIQCIVEFNYVLICIFLIAMKKNNFNRILLKTQVSPIVQHLQIYHFIYLYLIELQEFFMYSGCEISVSFIYFKYSLWFVTCIFTFLMITFNKLIIIIIFNIINNNKIDDK